MDTVLGVNAHMLLSLHLIQEGESWTASVSKSLALIKATCSDIEDNLEVGPQSNQLMVHLSHYTKRLATMRMGYEYLATISKIAQRHSNLFSNGGER